MDKKIGSQLENTATKEAAFIIGNELAKRALEKDIKLIVFDRGNRPYHGRIKSVAEGARKAGLVF